MINTGFEVTALRLDRSPVEVDGGLLPRPMPLGSRLHRLQVKRVVPETSDAVSLVFDVPAAHAETFAYRAGQFVTVRVMVGDEAHLRSYSMSSAPHLDPDLQFTVKRVPGGVVSNWLNDHVRAGEYLELMPPAGTFVMERSGPEVVGFAGGSGITPIFAILKSVLAGPGPRARLLHANRDRSSAIFAEELDALAHRLPERFLIQHHADADSGFVHGAQVAAFLSDRRDVECFVCGPDPFMRTVEDALRELGVDPQRIHVERFTPAAPDAQDGPGTVDDLQRPVALTIRLGGRTSTVDHRRGTTLLQAARLAGLKPPSSCELGNCATCIARVVEGTTTMRNNDTLTDEEIADGWVLTCQAVPTSPRVRVIYE